MSEYNPKSPDTFKQVEIAPPAPPELNIVPTDVGSMVKVGDFISPKFRTGRSGWRLRSDGTAEFSNGVFRGDFQIGGTIKTISVASDVQFALDDVSSAGGGIVYLTPGIYTLTENLYVPTGVTLEGVSRDECIIECGAYSVIITGDNAYSTGTVTINNGDTTLSGNLTAWSDDMVGMYALLDGYWYYISDVTDGTTLTIDTYIGENLVGANYVIANPNFNGQINKLTIQNSTGAGIIVNYAMEPVIHDTVVLGCDTGVDMDYVVFPRILGSFNYNTTGLDMNFVEGYYIDYSEFNFNTGNGVTITDSGNATFFNSSINDNGGNGVTGTNVVQVAHISLDISGNTGKGLEFVSGCNDNGFTVSNIIGNGSDGIKLTATSDRNSISTCSIINSGGYGINIAAASCDNNYIVAPSFDNNASGNINDSGTLTSIISMTDIQAPPFFETSLFGSSPDVFTDRFAVITYSTTTIRITLQNECINTQRNVTSDWANADNIRSAVLIGNYLYLLLVDTGPNPDTLAVYRYDITNMSGGGTIITYSGQSLTQQNNQNVHMASDGVNFYFSYDAGSVAAGTDDYKIAKYTFSGTIFTYVSTVVCVSTAGDFTTFVMRENDGFFIAKDAAGNIRTFNTTGTLQETSPYTFAGMMYQIGSDTYNATTSGYQLISVC
jgi:hypothetical protein